MENKEKRKKSRKNTKKKKEERLEWLIKIIALAILAIIVLWINKYTEKQKQNAKVEELSFFQYIEDRRIDYNAELQFSVTGQIMEFKPKDIDIDLDLDSSPIYYSSEEKMIFAKDMAIVFPNRNGTMKKIKKYTPITNEWYATYLNDYSQTKKNDIDVTQAFLYDTLDEYVFLSDVNILAKGENYQLSPLSYAVVSYKEYLEIFNKESQTYTFIELDDGDDVIAKNDYYEINLSTDVLNVRDQEQLLLKNINYLNYIEN